MKKTTFFLCLITITFYLISSMVGLLSSGESKVKKIWTVHEEEIELHGVGLYANDSSFKAPIFQGTDASILFIVGPLSIILLIISIKTKRVDFSYLMASVMSFYLYQGLSISLGAMMNRLFILYLVTIGLNIIALFCCFSDLRKYFVNLDLNKIPQKGIIWLLVVNGFALFAAWFPELIVWTVRGKIYRSLEMYTSSVTKVLDLGIIIPLIIYAVILIYKKKTLGILIFNSVIGVGIIIGFVVIGQSIYQLSQAVELSMGEILVKGAIFSILSIVGIIIQLKTAKNLI